MHSNEVAEAIILEINWKNKGGWKPQGSTLKHLVWQKLGLATFLLDMYDFCV
jgi:hypothetical protein